MASFIENLWASVFEPGTTPTLLIATNVSFAALQAILFALLIATRSIHFVILSFLCGGLWYSTNWFVAELKVHQAQEEAAKKKKQDSVAASPSAAAEGSDTETEEPATPMPSDTAATSSSAPAPVKADDFLKQRKGLGESGYISTDSEWEQVDESDEKEQ